MNKNHTCHSKRPMPKLSVRTEKLKVLKVETDLKAGQVNPTHKGFNGCI